MVIENKTIKIWGTAFSLIGDLIMSLPQLNYFKNQYPDSYINFIIHKKISYCAPLFFNHPLIDRIKISDGWSDFGDNDYNIAKDCDIHTTSINHKTKSINNRKHEHGEFWYNERNCIDENALMSGIKSLDDFTGAEERYPFLVKWFDEGFDAPQKKGAYTFKKKNNKDNYRLKKSITIWPFAAYGRSQSRSPTLKWWQETVKTLIGKGFNIIHCGYINEPDLSEEFSNYQKVTDFEFLDQIKISLGSNFSIGTDSGSMWVLGAYSHPSIHLMTNWAENHKDNLLAFEPLNKNSYSLFNEKSCDEIKIDELAELCDKFYKPESFSIKNTISKFI